MIQIIVLYALFASTFSLGKVLLYYAQPIFLVGIRMSIAGIVLLAYQYFHKDTVFKFKKKDWKLYVQAILFTCYFPYIFRFWGLEDMSPSKASLLYTLGPFMTYMLSYLLHKEKITLKKTIGLLVGFIGLLPVLITPAPLEDIVGGIGVFSWAEIYIIISISMLSYGWLIVHRLVKEKNYAPAMTNGISMFAGGILALITSFIFEPQNQVVTDYVPFFGILAIVIIVSNLICHNMYGTLLKKFSPTFVSFASFLTPLFAAFYGWVFLNESISWEFFLSLICVAIGLGIFYQDELLQKRKDQEAMNVLEEL
ncbi:MAG: DMT family transporter [Candidatus Babeliales bacterium]